MATEIATAGYQSIRNFVQANWRHIELRDETGSAILRASTDDTRVSWTHSDGNQTLELRITVKGDDAEISLPQTFVSSAIFETATGGEELAQEEFTPFTMEEDGDELTVIHQLQIPQID